MPNTKFWILFVLWVFSLIMLSEEMSPQPWWLYWPCLVYFVVTSSYLMYRAWLVNRRQKTVSHRDSDLDKG